MFVTTVTARPLTQIKHIHYQVVHCVPGRIRLGIPKLVDDSKYASLLKDLVESLAQEYALLVRGNYSLFNQ